MDNNLKGACLAEFIGTGIFMFFGVGCVAAWILASINLSWWEICIIWGMGVAFAIYTTAGVSGAHLNPAVTIALWKFGNFEGKKVLPYIFSQIAGAFCAVMLIYFFYRNFFMDFEVANNIVRGSKESLSLAGIFSTYPNAKINLYQAFFIEFVITSILMALILALTDDGNGLPKGPLAPLLIGILIAVIGASIGPLTGFALNPARDLGPKLFAFLAGWGNIALTGNQAIPYAIIPIIAPILGALGGAWGYSLMIGKNLPKSK